MREVRIPEISENVQEGTVITVHVSEGDTIEADQNILEIETDKAAVDIPSPVGGTISEILVSEGDEVSVGDVVMKIDEDGQSADTAQEEGEDEKTEEPQGGGKPQPKESEQGAPAEKEEKTEEAPPKKGAEAEGDSTAARKDEASKEAAREEEAGKEESRTEAAGGEDIPASPATRRFARELGVELSRVSGSGPGGRITNDDVKEAARDRGAPGQGAEGGRESGAGERREKMSQVRRLTAENISKSWAAPHVTHFDEIDLSSVNEFIAERSEKVARAGGKLTVTAVLMVLCARALERFPRFNASVDMEQKEMVYHDQINIGLAVDTERGLLVPVVRDANRKSVRDIAVEIVELAERARAGKTGPDELSGGTFSISNLGGIGGTAFTPVIQSPHVAILGVSRATTRPVYDGEGFQPRPVLPVGLSYDHRANDGADAARFVKWLKTAAEDPLEALLEGGA